LLGAPAVREASVVDEASGRTVATVQVGAARPDPNTDLTVAPVDFSEVRTPGRYWLKAGPVQSYGFVVDDLAFDLMFIAMMRTYRLQRCGTEVRDPASGVSHAA